MQCEKKTKLLNDKSLLQNTQTINAVQKNFNSSVTDIHWNEKFYVSP